MNKSGKWAVVSGASSGIGAAASRALAEDGWSLVLVARNAEALGKVAAEIEARGGRAVAMPADAADGEAILRLAKRVAAECGPVDLLVNSAGAGEWRYVEETSPREIRAMMDAPFFAAFHLTHAFMPEMLARGAGLVVHVNSPVSSMGWPGATGYMAARWALRGFHEALCLDLAGTGVRSSHVVFGKVTSDYFRNNPGSEERLPAIARLVPLLSPEECARVIVRVARRPRREVFHPFMLRAFSAFNRVFPRLVETLAVRTSRIRRARVSSAPSGARPD